MEKWNDQSDMTMTLYFVRIWIVSVYSKWNIEFAMQQMINQSNKYEKKTKKMIFWNIIKKTFLSTVKYWILKIPLKI